MHWAVKYIGMKHVRGGREPGAVDCWGLLCLVYREEFQIELPAYPGVTAQSIPFIASTIKSDARRDWVELEKPVDGCAVAMSQRVIPHHVGIYVTADGGRVIHCWDTQNVISDTFRGLAAKGFQVIKFYQHHLWPTSSKHPILSSPPKMLRNTELQAV